MHHHGHADDHGQVDFHLGVVVHGNPVHLDLGLHGSADLGDADPRFLFGGEAGDPEVDPTALGVHEPEPPGHVLVPVGPGLALAEGALGPQVRGDGIADALGELFAGGGAGAGLPDLAATLGELHAVDLALVAQERFLGLAGLGVPLADLGEVHLAIHFHGPAAGDLDHVLEELHLHQGQDRIGLAVLERHQVHQGAAADLEAPARRHGQGA